MSNPVSPNADMVGKAVPSVVFPFRENDQWVTASSDDLFAGKTVVLFSLPGAFTPTCSSAHLPRYNELAGTFAKNGVDSIICMSVNDTFVMNAWKEDQEAENITVIPDGNGEFTAGMGMLVDKGEIGFGKRSWRYSMLVKNGIIEKMFVEPDVPGDPFEVSDADTMLNYINPNAAKPSSVAMITKPGCPHCSRAKTLLSEHGIAYEEIVLGKDATSVSVKAISGNATVPQIFFDGKNIGGSDDLAAFLTNQK
ncbi:glutathione peroxidase [Arenicella xantha]|uniref:Glutaredoxin-like protein n=1 Tax=Arenicella xantha TaxID=644221 RepID=A0A395JHH1_9GAMM|nr:glutathione peroxidase [Arenicella xantha]RBP48309.1 glutaredoxin-like protein [Arenicella xantha]